MSHRAVEKATGNGSPDTLYHWTAFLMDLLFDRFSRTPIGLRLREYFVCLRTRMAVGHDLGAIEAIEKMIGDYPEMLAPDGDYTPFSNGFVIRYSEADTSAVQLAERWASPLQQFEAWAIHDGIGEAAESFKDGPVSRALGRLRQLDSKRQPVPLSQVFAVFHHPDEVDPRCDPDRGAEFIAGAWQHPTQSAFHFANGRVLFVGTTEPTITLSRRLQSRVQQYRKVRTRPRFDEIALFDGTGAGQNFFKGGDAFRQVLLWEEQQENEEEETTEEW
jgi:hypothetical protein